MNLQLKKQLLDRLAGHGWSPVDAISLEHTQALATKDYPTAVGTKTALAYLVESPEHDGALIAEYQSEGRNVLETIWHSIVPDLDVVAETFAKKVDERVGNTYAVHLYRMSLMKSTPHKILQGAEFSEHLDQFRGTEGSKRYTFHYDPQDHTNVIKETTFWAPDLSMAKAVANQMCREFGMKLYLVEEAPQEGEKHHEDT